jgi:light-regulated signal transduction histidine kinase (bacteriophytochrome)/CheY-like chemotaxis protein
MVQPHGIVLAADPANELALVAASANASQLLPDGSDVLAVGLGRTLGSGFVAGLNAQLAAGLLSPSAPWEVLQAVGGSSYDVLSHKHDGLVLIELGLAPESDAPAALRATRGLQRAVAEMRGRESDLAALSASVVRSIRALTGYERVLVYRFDADWNGQAIAEDMVEDWSNPLLGLHFPESDIPAQARELYRTSLIRWTQSRDADPVSMRSLPEWSRPIDLSYSQFRSLSPVHMQYHRNLGVDGAMSISIMDGQKLWGLVVCHHRAPHRTTAAERAAALALTDAFALRIRPAELAGAETARHAEQARYQTLIAHMAGVDDLDAALTQGPVTVLDLFDVPGAAVVRGAAVSTLGTTPAAEEIAVLAAWLRTSAPGGEVFATSALASQMEGWTKADVASGLLAVFLDPKRTDILMWFRPEEPTQVSWGGNPVKGAQPDGRVLPRQSFDRWVEERRGLARPWAPHEVEIATLLRHAITDVILRNVRRFAALNEQLRQSQKMEAVGQLTGGLAHDFNNLLGGITSSLELARMRIAQGRGADLDRYLAAALGSAGRAASLTNRLLSFSRRQTLDPKPVNANRLIGSMEELIRRTMGPSIVVDVVMAAGLWTILCDGNQLESALLNLSLNARDAMKQGGRLTIEATNVRMDDVVAASYDMPPGHYVGLSVTDTGHGMTPEVANRVFEPFFTTKPMGQGTGLGLSMVYGFAKQSGGQVRVYSEPGQGTTVRLYLPRHMGPVEDEIAAARPVQPLTGAAILVVDDEPVLRSMVCEALIEDGHRVTEAADGRQALDMLERMGPFSLLVTDVGLPGGMNGRQVAEKARQGHATLKVLFMTGYAENAALSGGLLGGNTQVLTKPFGLQTLVDKVRSMVEGAR